MPSVDEAGSSGENEEIAEIGVLAAGVLGSRALVWMWRCAVLVAASSASCPHPASSPRDAAEIVTGLFVMILSTFSSSSDDFHRVVRLEDGGVGVPK